MKQIRKWDEKTGMVFLLIGIFMLAISVFLCFSSDIWYDELFTMGFSVGAAKDAVALTARDVHPPLYYLIVNFVLRPVPDNWATQVTAAKVVSVVPFFLCLLYAVTKVRKHFGMLTAGLFSFLVVSMPQLPFYTVEIRMYGYALFFVTAAMLHGYELQLDFAGRQEGKSTQLAEGQSKTEEKTRKRKSRTDWIALTLYALAACYTHYFACVAACMVYLYLLTAFCVKKKVKLMIKPFFISGIVCAVGYLPWLLTVVTNQVGKVKDNYWIEPVSLRTLGGCVKFIFKPSFQSGILSTVLAVVFFGIFAVLLSRALISGIKSVRTKKKQSKEQKKQVNDTEEALDRNLFAAGCFGVLAGLVLFGVLASLLLRPVFVYRYMLPAMGVFWLGFSVLATTVLKEKKKLVTVLLLFLAVIGVRNYRAFYGDEMWKRVQMKETEKVLSQMKREDLLLFNFDQTQAVVSAYLPNDTYLWYGKPEELIRELYPSNHALTEGEFTDEAGMEQIRAFLEEGKTVWYLGSGNAREEIREKWKKEGLLTEEKSSVLLERYWFNVYALHLQSK